MSSPVKLISPAGRGRSRVPSADLKRPPYDFFKLSSETKPGDRAFVLPPEQLPHEPQEFEPESSGCRNQRAIRKTQYPAAVPNTKATITTCQYDPDIVQFSET
jgi:hypothetical protein